LVLATRRPRDKRWKSLCSQRRGRICLVVVRSFMPARRPVEQQCPNRMTGSNGLCTLLVHRLADVHRSTRGTSPTGFHAVQFSKTACHVGTGVHSQRHEQGPELWGRVGDASVAEARM